MAKKYKIEITDKETVEIVTPTREDIENQIEEYVGHEVEGIIQTLPYEQKNIISGEEETYIYDGSTYKTQVNSLKNYTLDNVQQTRQKTKQKRPIISFVDDDGRSEVWTKLKPLYDNYGIKYTLAIITGSVGTENFLTWEQIKELGSYGWEMSNHTHNHYSLGELTYDQQMYQINTAHEILTEKGFKVNTICYPYSSRNDDTVAIARKLYPFGRATDNGQSMPNLMPLMSYDAVVTPLGSFFAWGDTPYQSDSLDYYKYMVDKAVETNGWLIFMTHVFSSQHDETQQQYLIDTIEYIQSLDIPILTLSEALEERSNIIDIGRYWSEDLTKNHFVLAPDGSSSGTTLQSNFKVLSSNTYTCDNVPSDFEFGITIVNVNTGDNRPESGGTGILITTNTLFIKQEWRFHEKNITYIRYAVNGTTWSNWEMLNEVIVYPNDSKNFSSEPSAFQNGAISYVRMTTNQAGGPLNFGGGLLITNRTARYALLQYQEFVGENNPDRVFRRYWINGTSSWSSWLRITNVELSTTARNSANFQKNTGDMVFDTTLGIPVWWNGTKFVKADGTDAD